MAIIIVACSIIKSLNIFFELYEFAYFFIFPTLSNGMPILKGIYLPKIDLNQASIIIFFSDSLESSDSPFAIKKFAIKNRGNTNKMYFKFLSSTLLPTQ